MASRDSKTTGDTKNMAEATNIQAVIKNYGIMWRRDHIFWGKGRNKGALEGRRSAKKTIDFREQIGVYVLYDEARRPIYVGQAGQGNARLFVRLRSHTRDHLAHRWHYVSWFGLLQVNKSAMLSGFDAPTKVVKGTLRSTLNEIEGVLIAATEPSFNKQGARFRGIALYQQVKHPNAEAVSTQQIYDLMQELIATNKRK